jgi:hypothetical protein
MEYKMNRIIILTAVFVTMILLVSVTSAQSVEIKKPKQNVKVNNNGTSNQIMTRQNNKNKSGNRSGQQNGSGYKKGNRKGVGKGQGTKNSSGSGTRKYDGSGKGKGKRSNSGSCNNSSKTKSTR